jgi:GNAT superfamily N-acetyltransferase
VILLVTQFIILEMSVTNITDTSDSLVYRAATAADCDSLTMLINNAYRGPLSYQGWTNEDTLIPVPRTNANALLDMINADKCVLMMFFGKNDEILKGCIYLSHKPESKSAKISCFAVRPDLQARGYGKFILSTVENYAVNNWNVEYIELTAILQRPELITYYSRRGYMDTGQRHPFPTLQLDPGCTMRDDLQVCTMLKYVKKNEEKTIT